MGEFANTNVEPQRSDSQGEGTPSPELTPEPNDAGTPAPESQATEQEPDAQADLAEAERLREVNEQVESEQPRQYSEDEVNQLVTQRAEELLMEVFPGQDQTAQIPGADPRYQPQPQGEDDEDNELSFEERIERIEQAEAYRAQQAQIQQKVQELNTQLDNLQQKYPHMDRRGILLTLSRVPEDRQVNLERLADTSHKAQLARFEAYHQERLKQITKTTTPTPTPAPEKEAGVEAGAEPPRTFDQARKSLAEKLRARGWK